MKLKLYSQKKTKKRAFKVLRSFFFQVEINLKCIFSSNLRIVEQLGYRIPQYSNILKWLYLII